MRISQGLKVNVGVNPQKGQHPVTAASGTYTTTSTSALTINFAATDAVGHAYVWNYYCMETQ